MLAEILNMPPFMTECLNELSADEMFREAKYADGIQFNQFYEWIHQYMMRVMYDRDNEFFKLDLENHRAKMAQKKF